MTAASFSSTEFHLALADAPLPVAGPAGLHFGTPPATPTVIPTGVSRLIWDAAQIPSLAPSNVATVPHHASPKALPQLEPVVSVEGQPKLLLTTPPHQPATVNGVRAPRLVLLSEGDRFHFDAGPLISVCVSYRPQLGPVPSNFVGTPCAVCSLTLAAGDRCLVCGCSTPMHAAEDESQPGALACVKMVSLCPHCQSPIRLVPGYGERSAINELFHPHE